MQNRENMTKVFWIHILLLKYVNCKQNIQLFAISGNDNIFVYTQKCVIFKLDSNKVCIYYTSDVDKSSINSIIQQSLLF